MVEIKRMETPEEIDGKGFVHYQSWHETYPGLMDAAYLKAHTLEKCIANSRRWTDNTLIAKDGDRVVGFAAYGSCRDGDLPDCGEVGALYVLREYHGTDVGYRLMQAAVKELSEYDKIVVWVLDGNDRAIRFYRRFGFEFDGKQGVLDLGLPAGMVSVRRRMILK